MNKTEIICINHLQYFLCGTELYRHPVHSSACPLGNRSAPGQPAGSWWLNGSHNFNLETASISPIRGFSLNALPWRVAKELCKHFWAAIESPSRNTRENLAYYFTLCLSFSFLCPLFKAYNHGNGPVGRRRAENGWKDRGINKRKGVWLKEGIRKWNLQKLCWTVFAVTGERF